METKDYKELTDPIIEGIEKKRAEIQRINDEISADEQKIQAIRERYADELHGLKPGDHIQIMITPDPKLRHPYLSAPTIERGEFVGFEFHNVKWFPEIPTPNIILIHEFKKDGTPSKITKRVIARSHDDYDIKIVKIS